MRFKKGDQIKIMTGRDRGKTGAITRVLLHEDRIVVDGLNVYKKRSRPKQQGKKGEMVLLARPLSVSNVMLVCGSCKKTTRIGVRTEGDKKMRYCKKCAAPLN